MRSAFIAGVGLTAFGRHEGFDTLDLMTLAAREALSDAGLERGQIDGVVTGYSTSMPHLMLATLFCEHFGLSPSYANALQLGGATGAAMVMQAKILVQSGQCERVLVVAGENRLTNKGGRDQAIQTLAQVGHAHQEVPFGAMIPGYYALLAGEYLARSGASTTDLAQIAVYMRRQAQTTEGAHLTASLTLEEAVASRPIATPLRIADCCPISDGAAAFIVSATPSDHGAVRIAGAGQAHKHQHISSAVGWENFGAADAADRAFSEAAVTRDSIEILGIYDSFTVTLAMLLEETGFAPRGGAGRQVASGFHDGSDQPLNTHGGLLSYGHPGVAGGMAHLVEVTRQMQRRAGTRQTEGRARSAYVHADGGVLSAHVGLVLATDRG
ncbi:MAG: thiolase [Alphaproteobacteria bacterium HGW-Alphaproteobacteria-1]|jgi:acetyl-CoA acetyltransferase|nr:MAG: thiolase [Alphaproteobacteria bacterium HGW-Alphaproteobacteria-1]